MNNASKPNLFLLIIVSGLFLLQCGKLNHDETNRSHYLERYSYKQHKIDDIKLRLDPVIHKLHSLMKDSSIILANDSARYVLQDGIILLEKCGKFLIDLEELEKQDSLMFEKIGM